MASRDHRNRLLVHIDAGENPRGLGDARETFFDNCRIQMLKMQVDVVVIAADTAAFSNFGSSWTG